jgi:hypothetical protein
VFDIDQRRNLTGGGFSAHYAMPSFQSSAITNYLSNYAVATATNTQVPASGYKSTGRGYPDVSLLARNYVILIGGSWQVVSGTVRSWMLVWLVKILIVGSVVSFVSRYGRFHITGQLG